MVRRGAAMSHYRNLGGGKRDSNEPQVMKRFRHHGWHAEQISGNRLWDLLAFPPQSRTLPIAALVDVKQPDGEVTKAQSEKWTALHALGIPVYVVRTEADVDALVGGTLAPWEPESKADRVAARLRKMGMGATVVVRDGKPVPRKGDAAKARAKGRSRLAQERLAAGSSVHAAYTPPRSTPVAHRSDCEQVYHRDTREPCTCGALDAAKEAEATFAPSPEPHCPRCLNEWTCCTC